MLPVIRRRLFSAFLFTFLLLLPGYAAAQDATATPNPFDFGDQVVGTTDTQTFTFENIEATPLAITNATLTGDPDFTISADNCAGQNLGLAGTCTVDVDFDPTTTGVQNTTLSIVSNDPAPPLVAITGNGVQPVVDLSPTSLSFGNVVVGVVSASQPITLTNDGTSDLTVTLVDLADGTNYNIVGETCTTGVIIPAATCTIDVEFAPTATGLLLDTVEITSDAPTSVDTVPLDGTGVEPEVDLVPTSLSFGSVAVGNVSPSQAVTLTNTGTSDLTVSSVVLATGMDFNLVSQDCVTLSPIAPSDSCTIVANFEPGMAGPLNDSITILSDASTSPDSVALDGIGLDGPFANVTPLSLDFGNVAVGATSPSLTAQLTNIGNEPLAVLSAPIINGSADFAIVNETCSDAGFLQPNEDCLVEVVYSPSAAGAAAATTLDFDTDAGPASADVTGTGVVGPVASVTPLSLDFGSVGIGQSSTALSAQLTNTGTTLLTITSAAVLTGAGLGEYAIANDTCGTGTLSPAQSCLVEVVYTPTVLGAAPAATLDFATDGGAASVTLTGSGVEGPLATASHTTLDFGTVDIGASSAPQAVRLTNSGTADLSLVAAPVLSGAGAGEYEIVSDTCVTDTLQPGEDCLVHIVYTPTADGPAPAASLDFDTDANDLSVDLTGIGNFFANALVSPTTLAFGDVAVGQSSAPLNVQLTNDGITTLTFTAAPVITGSTDFTILNDGCGTGSLGAHESCIVQVVYTPSAVGPAGAASLDFDTDANDPSVPLTGSGVDGALAEAQPATLDFGTLAVGAESTALAVQLTNVGTAPLTIDSAPALTGSADFVILNDACPVGLILAPAESCFVEISFTPSAAGPAAATLDFDTDANDPSVAVSGAGSVGPVATVQNTSLDFGMQAVDTVSAARTVQLTNTGSTPLTITSVGLGGADAGEFDILNETCTGSSPLPAGTDCLVEVRFAPSLAAVANASLDFVTDGGSPSATLTGEGVIGPIATVQNLAIDFGDQAVGSSSEARVVQLSNTGTTALTITGLVLAGANPGDFAILNETCTAAAVLEVGQLCIVELQFAPTATGPLAASLDFTTDGGNPSVALSGMGVDADLSASAPLFPDTLAGASSAVQLVTISNAPGAADAAIGTITLAGDNPNNFQIVEDDCSNTLLAGGASCDVGLVFQPDDTAAFSAILSVPNDSSAQPLTVALAGLGVGPILSVAPLAPFDYGDVPILDLGLAGVQTFTISNTSGDMAGDAVLGTLALVGLNVDQFMIVADACSNTVLAFGTSCDVDLVFAPTSVGLKQAELSIPSNDPVNPVLNHAVEGTGVASALSVTPGSPFDFLTVPVDTASAPEIFTIENIGAAPLNIGQLALVGADPFNFAISADACSNTVLAPAATCDYEITFFPEDEVSYTATLSIPSNDPASPFSYSLLGEGIVPGLEANPSFLSFGSQAVGSGSVAQTVTLSNAGAADVTILNVTRVGTQPGDFQVVRDNCSGETLVPAGSCEIDVVFQPESTGAKSANLLVESDEAQSPFLAVPLSGTGIQGAAPRVGLSPTVLDFDNVEPATVRVQNVTLSNLGTGVLSVSAVAIEGVDPGPFSATGDCTGANLASGESCTEAVTFAPNFEDNFNSVLTFATNVPTDPSFVVLIGSSAVDNEGGGCSLSTGKVAGGKMTGMGGMALFLIGLGLWLRRRPARQG